MMKLLITEDVLLCQLYCLRGQACSFDVASTFHQSVEKVCRKGGLYIYL